MSWWIIRRIINLINFGLCSRFSDWLNNLTVNWIVPALCRSITISSYSVTCDSSIYSLSIRNLIVLTVFLLDFVTQNFICSEIRIERRTVLDFGTRLIKKYLLSRTLVKVDCVDGCSVCSRNSKVHLFEFRINRGTVGAYWFHLFAEMSSILWLPGTW